MSDISIKNSYHGNLEWLADNTVFATKHGSFAYGTNIEGSDIDVKGFCIPPKEYFLGFNKNFEQAESKEPDMVIYDIRKFFSLAAQCNPNIIEVLHTDESDWIQVGPIGKKIIENKDRFISMKAKHTFSGYAHAQLHRIQTHYRWLKNPPKAPPTRKEFGLPESTMIPMDQLMAVETELQKKIETWDINWNLLEPAERINMQSRIANMLAECRLTTGDLFIVAARSLGFNDNFIEYLKKERSYKQKMNDWKSYQDWKKTRNPARAALEEQFGYDTKHAGHLVRLMRMCREIITTGKVIVKRPDAEELIGIRKYGIWSYEKLIEWTDQQEKELNALYQNCKVIPYTPDMVFLNNLCQEVVQEFLEIK